MEFLTNDKLTIVGAAGMIGSNMAQTALMMRLTPNICLYDPYAPALEGVFYGTGDIFASAFAALLVRGAGAGQALEAASALVRGSIERSFLRDTPRPWGVDFEGVLPDYIRRVEAIFSPST